jgi:hypothetical protein
MPKKIGNTMVPRNPVAPAAASRRGGVHERSKTSERQHTRSQVDSLTENWRDDVAFETSLKSNDQDTESKE